jgi:hypothetical protein
LHTAYDLSSLAVQHDPSYDEAFLRRANILVGMNKEAEATSDIVEALRLNNQRIKERMRKTDDDYMKRYYAETVGSGMPVTKEINETRIQIFQTLVDIYTSTRMYEEIVEVSKEVELLMPSEYFPALTRAEAEFNLGRLEVARDMLRRRCSAHVGRRRLWILSKGGLSTLRAAA